MAATARNLPPPATPLTCGSRSGEHRIRATERPDVFTAPHATINGLAWSPAGPGPDPAVLLESGLAINGKAFRLRAFRVPMPFSAGWSPSPAWEDDKGLQGEGLLWEPHRFREMVRAADADPHGLAAANPHAAAMDPEMQRLDTAWRVTAARLGWPGVDWRPAMIGGYPYMPMGWPDSQDRPFAVSLPLAPAQGRTWFGRGPRQHRVNLLIEGAPCVLDCVEVRALGGNGSPSSVRPLDAGDSGWLDLAEAVLETLRGAGGPAVFPFSGRTAAGLICPADASEWSFDSARFVEAASLGLREGHTRWALGMPLGAIDAQTAAILEGVAMAVRERRVSRLAGAACVSFRLDAASAALGLCPAMADAGRLRAALSGRLGRVAMRGLWRQRGIFGNSCGRAAERVYVFPDTAYIGLSAAFTRLADACGDGDLLGLADGRALPETPQAGEPSHPGWVAGMPAIADGRIRSFVAGLGKP